jgi:hypothetical protein
MINKSTFINHILLRRLFLVSSENDRFLENFCYQFSGQKHSFSIRLQPKTRNFKF